MPLFIPVTRETVPDALTAVPQWLCWQSVSRDGKPTKVPINAETGEYASVNDAGTWTGFTTAYQYYRSNADINGVGFVFTESDGLVGVDLDDCRHPDTGTLTDWAADIITRLDSYTEASPSRTGVHIITRGQLPADGNNRCGDIELYDRDRYFTVTGRHLDLTPDTVNTRTATVAAVQRHYVADTADDGTPDDNTRSRDPSTGDGLSDDAVIRYATNAANADRFQRLWNGDTTGYPSHSEADQALCNLLAFWTGGDPQQIERLFHQSGLVRDKWRERPDYRERTIETAIRDVPDYFDPEN